MAGKILIVDDEEGVRFFAAEGLAYVGWQVYEADSGKAALAILQNTPCDVLLLDLRMAGMDGLSVLRQVKERWPDTTVIIMTGYASVDSAIEAVHYGVFDYLRKPYSINDIIASASRALVKKEALDQQRQLVQQVEEKSLPAVTSEATSPPIIHSGKLVIHLGAHIVALAGQPISLTPTEYKLLELLARSPGQMILLGNLIQEILDYDPHDFQAQETLRVHISRLRRKLGSGYILTTRGGYALANLPSI